MGNKWSSKRKRAYSQCGSGFDASCNHGQSEASEAGVDRARSLGTYIARTFHSLPSRSIFDAVRPATRLNLSSNERSLLCNTWVTSFDGLYDLGTDIYTEIFNSAPEIRALFPVLADSDGNIRNCPNFRNQALKFVQVIALCLTALNNAERLDEILTEVGARHAKYVAKGFKMAYWDVFENAMVKCIHQQMIRRGAFDDDTQAKAEVAWRTLSKYIIEKMKIGFICELHHFRRRNFKRSANEASMRV